MPDFVLSVGGVPFFGWEVPETVPFGGDQHLAIHKFIGGTREIHAQGRDDEAIEWKGRFRGFDAVNRARVLDALRVAGDAVSISCGPLAYTGVIKRFHGDLNKFYEIPYSITIEVLSDEALSDADSGSPSAVEQLGNDTTAITAFAGSVGNGGLSGLVSLAVAAVQAAIPGY